MPVAPAHQCCTSNEFKNLDYFLGCYFHTLALIVIMEYIQNGNMSFEARDIVNCAIQAEKIFSLHKETSWSYRRNSLFTALALLLVPQIYDWEGNQVTFVSNINYRAAFSKATPLRLLVSKSWIIVSGLLSYPIFDCRGLVAIWNDTRRASAFLVWEWMDMAWWQMARDCGKT